jgi:hypothetical protein
MAAVLGPHPFPPPPWTVRTPELEAVLAVAVPKVRASSRVNTTDVEVEVVPFGELQPILLQPQKRSPSWSPEWDAIPTPSPWSQVRGGF